MVGDVAEVAFSRVVPSVDHSNTGRPIVLM
jgi:hypothetical protein